MALSHDPRVPPVNETEREVREAFGLDLTVATICFYCGEPVAHPAVYWHGYTSTGENVWFHPDCALGLAQHLVSDVRRLNDLIRLRARLSHKEAA